MWKLGSGGRSVAVPYLVLVFEVGELVLFGPGNVLDLAVLDLTASDLAPEIKNRSRPAQATETFVWFAAGLLLMLSLALHLHRG